MDVIDHIYDESDGILAELEGVEEVSAENTGVNTFRNGQIGHIENMLIRGIVWGGAGR
jgi:hypothetical protein